MATLVIVGAQWGDEAKGKMVDVLGSQADVVVRYSGGNNAGHTVIAEGKTYKFQLLPAGVLHQNCTSILAGGMVICPSSLLEEIEETKRLKGSIGKLVISPAAHVVFPYHRLLDKLEEEARGENKIGTTSRGIGPAYTDKVQRIGIRFGEFVNRDRFERRLRDVLSVKNRLMKMFGEPEIPFDSLFNEYCGYADQLRHYVADSEWMLQEAVAENRRVLFEGAQGTYLDLDSGTYPYVTSSHPTTGGACLGTGIGPRDIHHALGVCKAYTTRVGEGPFPTELHDDIGQQIRDQGHEYGTVTGRPRRCGWLDMVALRHSCRVNSLSGLIVTRVDVMSGIEKVKLGVQYRLEGMQVPTTPTTTADWNGLEVEYETLPGWDGDLTVCRSMSDLPQEARVYLEAISDFTKTPIAIVSIGPDRKETIIADESLIWG